jgi:hypothetical protein
MTLAETCLKSTVWGGVERFDCGRLEIAGTGFGSGIGGGSDVDK